MKIYQVKFTLEHAEEVEANNEREAEQLALRMMNIELKAQGCYVVIDTKITE